jgi:hypothetical protein
MSKKHHVQYCWDCLHRDRPARMCSGTRLYLMLESGQGLWHNSQQLRPDGKLWNVSDGKWMQLGGAGEFSLRFLQII